MRPFIIARKGDPVGLRQRPARRNLLIFRHDFTESTTWSAAIDALMRSLGGWEAVGSVVKQLSCLERPIVQLTLPIRNSPHQENDFIEAATLRRLAELEFDLGFEFGEHPPAKNG